MGLDADVMCDCLKDGTSAPEEYGRIVIGPDGYLQPDCEYKGNEKTHHRFHEWLETICPHPHMAIASRRIGSWHGVGQFMQALSENNAKGRFNTLLSEIPIANGGMTSSENAARMRQEIEEFLALDEIGEKLVLVDSERDEIVWDSVPNTQSDMVLSGPEKLCLGIDDDGFYIRSMDGEEFFRSKAFFQTILPEAGSLADRVGLTPCKLT